LAEYCLIGEETIIKAGSLLYKLFIKIIIMLSRRTFIGQSVLTAAASLTLPLAGKSAQLFSEKENYFGTDFPIGIAGYTFAKFDVDQSIAMMKRVGINLLSVKEIHLPLNSSEEKIKATIGKYTAAGINVYTVGVIYMRSKDAVDQAFEYAKKVGVSMIVGVPNYDLIDYCEEKVKAYDIKLAIHNHGPKDPLYPSPGDVYERIKDKDVRLGLCIDIGHTIRAGVLPEKAVRDYKDRLFDLHIKDVTVAAEEGKAIEIGRGVINFPELIKALKKVQYKGVCSIEYEKDMGDPLAGIAESTGYFRAVVAAG
jgi:sugar phosphate isomerase/epimerase